MTTSAGQGRARAARLAAEPAPAAEARSAERRRAQKRERAARPAATAANSRVWTRPPAGRPAAAGTAARPVVGAAAQTAAHSADGAAIPSAASRFCFLSHRGANLPVPTHFGRSRARAKLCGMPHSHETGREPTGTSSAAQEYLACLRNLVASGQHATVTTVARRLHVSPQAASEMVQRLRGEGLVELS